MDKLMKKVQSIDWWEVTYLIIYAVIYIHEFEHTTMWGIEWPPRFSYIFIIATTLYTAAKFIWHNTYTKKEIIFSLLIILAFAIPAILTDYSFIFWIGFLIVSAKGIDFDKILKVYLGVSITCMIVTFSASQYGLIENLQYFNPRGDQIYIRYCYGSAYPTDYAAHWFFIILAAAVLFDKSLKTMGKVWISLLTAFCVYLTSNAQTTMLCLIGFAGLCVVERVLRKYMPQIEKVLRWTPVLCAAVFLGLAYFYDETKAWMVKLDTLLSFRLQLSKEGFDNFPVKLFGQNMVEVGLGSSTEGREYYFFLDDSYIRILLKYGLVLFIVTLVMLVLLSKRASQEKRFVLVMALVAIAVHSFMENRLIDIAFNPMMFAMFATLTPKEQINTRINLEKQEI